MASAVNSKVLFIGGVGGILLYSGIKGIGISTTARDLISGKSPSSETPTETVDSGTQAILSSSTSKASGGKANSNSTVGKGNRVYRGGGQFAGLDQGVDWTGSFTIHAPDTMKMTLVSTHSGWPGGTLIVGRLIAGPHKGRYAYFAEAITPAPGLRRGSIVQKGGLLGTVNSPYPGAETGFARDARGDAYGNTSEGKGGNAPDPQARKWSQYIDSASSGSNVGGSAAQNRTLGRLLATSYGWNAGKQWHALDQLWGTSESGWRNTARNPKSGAYGIAQALPYTKMPKAAWPPENGGRASARAQILWGLLYIHSRYGSPEAALAHEHANGWY